jgi:hypothetical protein
MLFIGDVHGKIKPYLRLLPGHKESLQIGDVGFESDYRLLAGLSERHKLIKGNHDYYGLKDITPPNFLGDFGVHRFPKFGDVFYVRGEYSIDFRFRTPYLDWFAGEELTGAQFEQMLTLYEEVKPRVVATHGCPSVYGWQLCSSNEGVWLPVT